MQLGFTHITTQLFYIFNIHYFTIAIHTFLQSFYAALFTPKIALNTPDNIPCSTATITNAAATAIRPNHEDFIPNV